MSECLPPNAWKNRDSTDMLFRRDESVICNAGVESYEALPTPVDRNDSLSCLGVSGRRNLTFASVPCSFIAETLPYGGTV